MGKKHTRYIRVDPADIDVYSIREAAKVLREGGLVAFPTETVYGLGANAHDGKAVSSIFDAKGRPVDNPLIVHLARVNDVYPLISGGLSQEAEKLMDAFWPGPLTLIFPKGNAVPDEVTAGLDTVAVRMPAHPVAMSLIKEAGLPVAAPSANLSGRPSPTRARHVYEDLNGRIDLVLDGGPADIGVESTVLDLTANVPLVLRPGGVTVEQLEKLLGKVNLDPGMRENKMHPCGIPRSPGMKYKHYAPKASIVLVEGEDKNTVSQIRRLAGNSINSGRKVGIFVSREAASFYHDMALDISDLVKTGDNPPVRSAPYLVDYGSREDPSGLAAVLFSRLRLFDELGVDIVYIEGIESSGLGLAVMDRLRRAAGEGGD